MAEWFKARAWKARVPKPYRGFESLSLRHFQIPPLFCPSFQCSFSAESRMRENRLSGLEGWVRSIPHPTPIKMRIAAEVRKSIANGMKA